MPSQAELATHVIVSKSSTISSPHEALHAANSSPGLVGEKQFIKFAQASPQGVPSETTSGGTTTGSSTPLVNNEHEAARLSVGSTIKKARRRIAVPSFDQVVKTLFLFALGVNFRRQGNPPNFLLFEPIQRRKRVSGVLVRG
jgi:hypothetical protein